MDEISKNYVINYVSPWLQSTKWFKMVLEISAVFLHLLYKKYGMRAYKIFFYIICLTLSLIQNKIAKLSKMVSKLDMNIFNYQFKGTEGVFTH